MSDAPDATPDPAQDQPEQGEQGEKTFTQKQLDKILANNRREMETLKGKAEQFDALTETAKTETEKAADWKSKAEAAETELAWRDTLLLRQEIAAAKGLDSRLWSRVQGETRDEIEADISELQGFGTPARRTSLRSGASNDQQTTAKERAANALRGARDR
jgi:hypothetical protein